MAYKKLMYFDLEYILCLGNKFILGDAMNVIDKNFWSLIDKIKRQSLEEVYQTIHNNYLNLDNNIQKCLEDYMNKFMYWGVLKRSEDNYEELYNRAVSLKNHIDDYVWLYDNLGDYRSKKLLFAILNNWYNFDFNTIDGSLEKNFPHYFDLDIVKCDKNEVLVDLGAYVGDTILDYLNYYGIDCYKKIYCYEVTDDSYERLKGNLRYYPNIEFRKRAALDRSGQVYVCQNAIDSSANTIADLGDTAINAVSIDDDIEEDVSLIKMDIEGAEAKALLGCKKHIIKNSPKLLISVYHNHEDLWKIPKMIDEMNKGYNYYLRCYGSNIFPTEIVLMAIKKAL